MGGGRLSECLGPALIFRTLTHRSPEKDLFNDDFSYKRKLKIKLPTPDGVVSVFL